MVFIFYYPKHILYKMHGIHTSWNDQHIQVSNWHQCAAYCTFWILSKAKFNRMIKWLFGQRGLLCVDIRGNEMCCASAMTV